jgi:hypothetical protein
MMFKTKFSLRKMTAVAVCLSAVVFSGCDDDPGDDPEKPAITLTAPADNASFDLSKVDKIAFSWNKAEGVTAYTLRLHTVAADAPASDVKFDAGDKNSYELTAEQVDRLMLGNTTVKPGETGDVYWTVTGGDATTQTRKVSIKRLPASAEPYINLSAAAVTMPAIPDEPQTVTVESNVDWAVEDDAEWLTATKGDGKITLAATPNDSEERRTATVTVSGAGAGSRTLAVTQLAAGEAPMLYIQPTSATFKATPDAPQEVAIVSNVAWKAAVDEDAAAWLAVAPASGTGEGAVTLTAQPNTTGKARSATVTVTGEGVAWPATVSVTQLAAGSGDASALLGTWYMVRSEQVQVYSGIVMKGEYLNGESFTLLENGTWTGNMQSPEGNFSDPVENNNTWKYEGGALIVNESTHNVSWPVTVAGKELVLEKGVAGKDGYHKVTYSRDAVTVPPMPESVTPYKGAESMFIGAWALVKQEYCTSYDLETAGNPFWESTLFNAADEVMVYTIKADHTYSEATFGEGGETGEWSFDAATGVISIDGQPLYIADASSTASQLVWVQPAHQEGVNSLVFGRLTLKKI